MNERSTLQGKIIDGKALANEFLERISLAGHSYKERVGTSPRLVVVLVGNDPASAVYVRNKGKAAEKIGFESIQKILPDHTTEHELTCLIDHLNDDPLVNGILIQLPLPNHVCTSKILERIRPDKDVDGFHPINIGYLATGKQKEALLPCTPCGCLALAKSNLGQKLSGLHTVIVGRSNIVGKPAAHLFLAEDCTVTIAHSHTQALGKITRSADILIAAVGRPEIIKQDMIKPGATVIDVGINHVLLDGKLQLVGDVHFSGASSVAGAITPVPGGVGPMTIAMLMQNTLIAACRQNSIFLLET